MESIEIFSLLEQLDDDIDELEDSLAPVLETALSASSSKLLVLDKAKLYVLVTYAIESMLFSYLRLNGVKAREHPVFKELTRVKQYFGKIQDAEKPSKERPVASLDKQAAVRFIKSGLTGNDEYDSRRARPQEVQTFQGNIKFDDSSMNTENAISSPSITNNSDSSSIDLDSAGLGLSGASNASKKRKADVVDDSVLASSGSRSGSDSEPRSRKRKKSKEEKKERKQAKNRDKELLMS